MKTKCALFVLAAVVAALVILPATASAAVTLTPKEQRIVALINEIRADHGLAQLTVKPCLVRAARVHSGEMGARQYFSHDSYNGESFDRRLLRLGYVRTGYTFWKVGENLAWGGGLYATPEVIVNGWMHSPAHRTVILTRTFRHIGVGVRVCADGFGGYGDPVSFCTLDLGRRIL
jgi:uncharacterized protein YkwD